VTVYVVTIRACPWCNETAQRGLYSSYQRAVDEARKIGGEVEVWGVDLGFVSTIHPW
jgi:hypothetical protein